MGFEKNQVVPIPLETVDHEKSVNNNITQGNNIIMEYKSILVE
ncbi:1990_t:CDS:2 [Cetraspora pellucida]|uniref:1990_t:CDS:1 n=1 Tax=Cetraspora pellucida TaxID=1433469 RepID=A0ACA9KDH4_9GLOM|nr:1990_t:CDS:2 [Cetraspora pellucida]